MAQPIPDADRDSLKDAWHRFCTTALEEGLRVLDQDANVDSPRELAEGLRHVARMSAYVLQNRIDFRDGDFPKFYRFIDDRVRFGAPNVDNHYLLAAVRGDATYRITGNGFGRLVNVNRLWSSSPDFDLHVDGSFEIIASAAPHPGNWVPLDPDVRGDRDVLGPFPGLGGSIQIRVYQDDWSRDLPPPLFHIERIDDQAPDSPETLQPATVARQIDNATRLLPESLAFYERYQEDLRGKADRNSFPVPDPWLVGNFKQDLSANNPLQYSASWYELAEDEALVVRCRVPDAYWGFQLTTRWYESPDFQDTITSLNSHSGHVDSDGLVALVLCSGDPGCANWLDSHGAMRGWLFYRTVNAPSMKAPEAEVVQVSDVWRHLPKGHPRVTPVERRAEKRQRRRFVASQLQR